MQLHEIKRIIRHLRDAITMRGTSPVPMCVILNVIDIIKEFELTAYNAKKILLIDKNACVSTPNMTIRMNDVIDIVYSYLDDIYAGVLARQMREGDCSRDSFTQRETAAAGETAI